MNIEDKILTLKKMLFSPNEEYCIEKIEDVLNEIALKANNNDIVNLCSVFNDEIEEPSIIGDLIETIFYIIERNELENGFYEIVEGINQVIPQAKQCVKMLCRSILASEDLIEPFINVLKKVEPSKRTKIIIILKEIGVKQSKQYSEKVSLILKGID